MKNRYQDKEAKALIARYRRQGVAADMALRIYTSRLLGAEKSLVIHGGGNTSMKTKVTDASGMEFDALCVKSSGHNLDALEPDDMTVLDLSLLSGLKKLKSLPDQDMIKALSRAKMDPVQPNPSVETLLHAFLPDAFIDHTHANAVLALTNQPNGKQLCEEVFGDRAVVVPYAMSGLALAKKAVASQRRHPNIHGIVLMCHGLFTFGKTAKESYTRMIRLVSQAEKRLKGKGKKVFAASATPKKLLPVAHVAPMVRGALSRGGSWILDFRTSYSIRQFVGGKDLARYAQAGPVTPDHVIRIKPKPLILPPPKVGGGNFQKELLKEAARFSDRYRAYFEKHNRRHGGDKTMRDPTPRVVLVPGLGLFGVGETTRIAAIAADMAATNIDVITAAEGIGTFKSAGEKNMFDIEYWALEAAKLGAAKVPPLAGRVAVITGGGSGIGAATAKAFADQGAAVAVMDLDGKAAIDVAASVGGFGLGCDVTDAQQIERAFDAIAEIYGGVDVVVSNAGAAWQGEIGSVDKAVLRKSFELNFWAHQTVAQNAVRVMKAQGVGGCLLFNTSKQAVNPGADFGPYGLPKAATLFLMRQYAVDHGKDGIRSNAVNADRIRSGLLTNGMIASRSQARGLTAENYMGGNLLGEEVLAEDVAKAFVDLALSLKTTGAVMTVDGGNIAAALR